MTISNVKMLQNLVNPIQFMKIGAWNKSRNSLKLDIDLEIDMLDEEFREYFDATELVDHLDAVCDLLFVGVGTEFKGAYNFGHIVPNFSDELEVVLSDFAGRCMISGIAIERVGGMISEGLDIVIEANEQKLAEKNADGKVQKPEGFVPPEEKLQALINSVTIASSAEVQKAFNPDRDL